MTAPLARLRVASLGWAPPLAAAWVLHPLTVGSHQAQDSHGHPTALLSEAFPGPVPEDCRIDVDGALRTGLKMGKGSYE